MALETGSFIDDLVITNPLGADAKNKGDDHIRLVKKVVKATFPGMAGEAWRVQAKSGAYTILATDNMTVINCTAALTLSLTAAATLGNQHIFFAVANGGNVTIDPNAAELINGAATLTVPDGSTAVVVCNGTLFLAHIAPAALTAFALTLLDDATAAAARSTIGLDTVSKAEAEAGTATTDRAWTAERVAEAVAALAGGGFPSGTKVLFQQTSAPTGWTKDTTHNNKALRVVTGAVGSGGATAFSSVFGSAKTTGNASPGFTSHSHTQQRFTTGDATSIDSNVANRPNATPVSTSTPSTLNAGSGSSHNHTLSLDLQFVDLIIATKD